jgi:hypothetical protein
MRRSSQETRRSRSARDIVPKHMRQIAKQRSGRCADIHNKELHTSLHSLFQAAQSTDRRQWRQLSGEVLRRRVRESRRYLFRGVPAGRLLYKHTLSQTLETSNDTLKLLGIEANRRSPDDHYCKMTIPSPRHSRSGPPGAADFRRADCTSGRERRSAACVRPAYSERDDGAKLWRVIAVEFATAE